MSNGIFNYIHVVHTNHADVVTWVICSSCYCEAASSSAAAVCTASYLNGCSGSSVKPVCDTHTIVVVEYAAIGEPPSCVDLAVVEINRQHLCQRLTAWVLKSNVTKVCWRTRCKSNARCGVRTKHINLTASSRQACCIRGEGGQLDKSITLLNFATTGNMRVSKRNKRTRCSCYVHAPRIQAAPKIFNQDIRHGLCCPCD